MLPTTRVILSLLLVQTAYSFYLPGVAPREFQEGDNVPLKVDKLSSVRSQLPFSFYHLPFCTPGQAGLVKEDGTPAVVENVAENLGEVLAGDRMESTGYQLHMQEHSPGCQILCRKDFDKAETSKITDFIDKEYRVNMWVDNLPAAQKLFSSRTAMEADVKRMDAMKKGLPVQPLTPEESDAFMYTRGYLIGQRYVDPLKNSNEMQQSNGP